MSRGKVVEKIPPEKIHAFQARPLGLTIGSRNGIAYVYRVNTSALKEKKPSESASESDKATYLLLHNNRIDRLKSLLGLRILRIQEIDVSTHSVTELEALIGREKLPIYVTFGERIEIFEELENATFDPTLHNTYFKAMLVKPPSQYSSMDVQRVTLLFFSLFALDLLNDIRSDTTLYQSPNDASLTVTHSDVIEWIYAQQIIPKDTHNGLGGFRGGSFIGIPFDNNKRDESERVYNEKWDRINMAATHNGMCVLLALGDDLSRVNKRCVLNTIAALQCENGCFQSMQFGESDMRFVFCAAAVSYLLGDMSAINRDKAVEYIQSCQTYCGAFAMNPGLEGHGGATYVAVAALTLLNGLNAINRDRLLRWALVNQGHGFTGRPNKPPDSCYSFWVGAVICLLSKYNNGVDDPFDNTDNTDETTDDKSRRLDLYDMTQKRFNRILLMLCQSGYGGFSKLPQFPIGDILHGYMGLAGLSLMGKDASQFANVVNPLMTCAVDRPSASVKPKSTQ